MSTCWIVDWIGGAVRLFVGLAVICCALSAGPIRRRGAAAVCVGAFAIGAVCRMPALEGAAQIALETVWLTVCAHRTQDAQPRMALFIAIFYEIAAALWRFIVGAALGMAFCSTAFLERGDLAAQAVFYLLLLALGAVICLRPEFAARRGARFVSGMAALGLLAVVTLSQQRRVSISDDVLSMWEIFALIQMMGVMVFGMSRQIEAEKEIARFRAERAELLEREYARLSRAYAVNARLFHDMHHHIVALRRLTVGGKCGEATEYLDTLQAPVKTLGDTAYTGDEAVDNLIAGMQADAQARQVSMEVCAEFPRGANIAGADLCTILGNLLDNALDAAGKVPRPQDRFVRLTIRRIHQMLVIKVENGYVNAPIEQAGELKSTKTADGLHGWGLRSARTAAEKYDGALQTTAGEGVFCAVATLSCRESKQR